MFRRRSPIRWHRRARDVFWPRAGWRRASAYVGHRLGRLNATPHAIAAGLASGVAAAITPLVGLHFLTAMGLAALLRGNLIAALLGTFFGNPWVWPFIWIASYRLGFWMHPEPMGPAMVSPAEFVALFADMTRAAVTLDLALFVDEVWPIWLPMMIGSLPISVAAWLVCYALVRRPVAAYQHRRREKRSKSLRARIAREGWSNPDDPSI